MAMAEIVIFSHPKKTLKEKSYRRHYCTPRNLRNQASTGLRSNIKSQTIFDGVPAPAPLCGCAAGELSISHRQLGYLTCTFFIVSIMYVIDWLQFDV